MDTRERQERQREGRRLLSARRARAGLLRGRVVAVSIICFGLLWAAVFVQMATGNDPVLSAKSRGEATASRVTRPATETKVEIEPVLEPEPEVVEEPVREAGEEPEVVEEPEPELEPLTTRQS